MGTTLSLYECGRKAALIWDWLKRERVAKTGRMNPCTVYVSDVCDLNAFHQTLKLRACPWCFQISYLIFNGGLIGYDWRGGSKRQVRGKRVFCSNRWSRRGCGRSFPVLFSFLLKGRMIPAMLVVAFVSKVLEGATRRSAWLSLAHGFSLESGYRLWADWLDAQSHVRSWLARMGSPPEVGSDGPSQTWAHLRQVFGNQSCPISAFQEQFQQPFFPN